MKYIIRLLLVASVLTTPAWAYITLRMIAASGDTVTIRWSSSAFPIQWRANPVRGANVSGAREQSDVFRSSFAQWQAVSTASLGFTEGSVTEPSRMPGFDQVNLVTTNISPAEWASYGIDAAGYTISSFFANGGPGFVDEFNRPIEFPGQNVEADILFNPNFSFSTSTTAVAGATDLEWTATHEIGHLLGLDHTTIVHSTMFPTIPTGRIYGRTLSADDIAGVSSIYPNAQFAAKGTISGTVRTTANPGMPVYGAIVVAVDANGAPAVSAITDPNGQYTINGLDSGTYTIYAEPMDSPFQFGNAGTLQRIYPGATVNSNFTTGFR
jgi:hypothetical protein